MLREVYENRAHRAEPAWRLSVIDASAADAKPLRRKMRPTGDGYSILLFEDEPERTRHELIAGATASVMSERADAPPWVILRILNAQTSACDPRARGWTALCAQFLGGGIVRIAWAGLPAAYVRTSTGGVARLHKASVALGIHPSIDPPETVTFLGADDAIMFVNRTFESLVARGVRAASDAFMQRDHDLDKTANISALVVRRIGCEAVASWEQRGVTRQTAAAPQ